MGAGKLHTKGPLLKGDKIPGGGSGGQGPTSYKLYKFVAVNTLGPPATNPWDPPGNVPVSWWVTPPLFKTSHGD